MDQPDHVIRFLLYWHFSLCNPPAESKEIEILPLLTAFYLLDREE